MPITVNSVGTRYFGKKGVTVRRASCKHCGREGELKSYQTRLWFCVLFIPIIPLYRRQIVDYCPRCTRHGAVSPRKWAKMQAEAFAEATREAQESPNDPRALAGLHATLRAFQKHAEAARVAQELEGAFPQDVDVQLYLVSVSAEQGDVEAERAHARRAFELAPSREDARRYLADCQARAGEVDEARALLDFALRPGPTFDADAAAVLGRLYADKGRHAEGLELLKQAIAAKPALGRGRQVREATRKCERALGAPASALPPSRRLRYAAVAVGVLLLAAFAVVGGMSLWKGRHQTLHVLNGLAKPVEVRIDGGHIHKVAAEVVNLPIAEGRHEALMKLPDGTERRATFVVTNSLSQRLSGKSAFVLNVAGAATMVQYDAVYASGPAGVAPPSPPGLIWGDDFVTVRDVDYLFQPAPESVLLPEHSKAVTRRALTIVHGEPAALVGLFLAGAPADLKLGFAERHLQLEPDDTGLLFTYTDIALRAKQVERCRAFLEQALAERPVRVAWSRAYAGFMERTGQQQAAEARFRQMLAEDPSSPSMAYLLSLVTEDLDESVRLLDSAVAAAPQLTEARLSRARVRAIGGDMEGALEDVREVRALKPDDVEAAALSFCYSFALGRYDELERDLRAAFLRHAPTLYEHLELLEVLGAARKLDEARQEQEAFARVTAGKMPGDPLKVATASRMELCYWTGDVEGCRQAAMQLQGIPQVEDCAFYPLLGVGALREAGDFAATRQPGDDGTAALLLSMAWRRKGNAEQAGAWMKQAVELLVQGTPSERSAAAVLQSKDYHAELLHQVRGSVTKAAILVLLAERHPGRASELLPLAEKLSGVEPHVWRFLAPFIRDARAGGT